MYGTNLLKVAKILGAIAISHILFSKYGAIRVIYQEIVKYSAQQNIDMVKVMMQTLAKQDEQAYDEIASVLREHFTEEELQDILPQVAKGMLARSSPKLSS